jgi:hypothetical protein
MFSRLLKSFSNRTLSVNDEAFNKDGADRNYWLGFLLCDGAINRRAVTVELQIGDARHLELLRQFVGTEAQVRIYRNGTSAVLQFSSPVIVNTLANYGIVPNKSYTCIAPETLVHDRDFWRGCIDADGTIRIHSKRNYPILRLYGTYKMCSQFRDYCRSICKTKASVLPCNSIHEFTVTYRCAAIMVAHLYYNGCTALARKEIIAKQIGNDFGQVNNRG